MEIRDSDWLSSRFLLAARQRSPFWISVRGKSLWHDFRDAIVFLASPVFQNVFRTHQNENLEF